MNDELEELFSELEKMMDDIDKENLQEGAYSFLNSEYAPFSLREENLFSEEYGDFYSSLKGAVEECKHVFIEGNNLTNRFKELEQNTTFFIGELGFGVGINFITTCSEWLKHTSDNH